MRMEASVRAIYKFIQGHGDIEGYNVRSRFEKILVNAERIVPLVSHLTQIGLFILTAWGLFHTVIPLYQKAAVDEQVAKQQVQLTSLTARLQENYVKNRRLIVSQFAIFAGPACSGLMTPVNDEPKSADKDFYSETLGIDVEQCLQKQLQGFSPLKDLTNVDQDALAAQIHRIGARIDTARLAANVKYGEAQKTYPTAGPVALGSLGWQALAEMKMLGASDGQIADAKHKMSIRQQQGLIVNEYLDTFRREMLNLENMQWTSNFATQELDHDD